jgi:hypothetical protein
MFRDDSAASELWILGQESSSDEEALKKKKKNSKKNNPKASVNSNKSNPNSSANPNGNRNIGQTQTVGSDPPIDTDFLTGVDREPPLESTDADPATYRESVALLQSFDPTVWEELISPHGLGVNQLTIRVGSDGLNLGKR